MTVRVSTARPKRAAAFAALPKTRSHSPITLAIDIGGSGLKAMLIDPNGKPVSERERVVTPTIPTPRAVLAALDALVSSSDTIPGRKKPMRITSAAAVSTSSGKSSGTCPSSAHRNSAKTSAQASFFCRRIAQQGSNTPGDR
jgi:predicted NBD/HSP70 family sugar kinase